MLFTGIDIGSVSVKVVQLDKDKNRARSFYRRHKGRPLITLLEILKQIPASELSSVTFTGGGGKLVSQILKQSFISEITAAHFATQHFLKEIKTLIEIGGQDSKLILFKDTHLNDFAMNSLCAAGTGSFLDQQASRLGIAIEDFGELALRSKRPPRIAGRCSVFAKTDMIHLQQKATPVEDILAGLCLGMARNFKGSVGKGKKIEMPIAFVGGVASNQGMVAAFGNVLELKNGELIVPEFHQIFGAMGAAVSSMKNSSGESLDLAALEKYLSDQKIEELGFEKLNFNAIKKIYGDGNGNGTLKGQKIKAYLGVDVGSISTNLVVMDENKNVMAKRYLMTAGRPLNAVSQGLKEIGDEIGDQVEICGVCTTGSGRYLTGDFIGADVVKNEITAQARASVEIDPKVDTIFEIGGQDSKYISLEDGAIIDFEMNKACAAGTGSFLEEQAEKLNINIKEEFGNLALNANCPARLGERCTVFMESDLVQKLQRGAPTDDLCAGLSYSIVYNYLNRVVQDKKVGDNIFFQGGVTFNRGVVAAFEKVTGKKITIPEHHEVTGAIGCCLLAQEYMGQNGGDPSKFRGFDLTRRKYAIETFECKACANRCEINRVVIEGERPLYYGSRCEKYDVEKKKSKGEHLPDLFAEREYFLEHSYKKENPERKTDIRIGIPRALFLYNEFFPFFNAYFSELDCEVVPSDPTNKEIIQDGVESVQAESCFPVKVAHGHVLNLLKKKVDYIFLPSIVELPQPNPKMESSHTCPYVLAIPYMTRAALPFEEYGTKIIEPSLYFRRGKKHIHKILYEIGKLLGRKRGQILKAIAEAEKAQERFSSSLRKRGEEVLSSLDDNNPALVIISRAYNGCDPAINLEIPKVLRNLGALAIPMDFLPLDSIDISGEWSRMYWRTGQRILAAAEIIKTDKRLNAVYITNFSCGPDSFLTKFFKKALGHKPFLMIEIDEHSSDVGAITRCEAFLDSIENIKKKSFLEEAETVSVVKPSLSDRILFIPNMCDAAYAVAAAFEANGVRAEVMPEGDQETLIWGKKYTSGKECYPCQVTTGDMIKVVKRPDFDPKKSAFFMPSVGGGCRFSYYYKLQRNVLDELGFKEVPIVSPNMSISFYRDLGIIGPKCIRQALQALIAVDMLEKCLRETRPYEVSPGETDKTYQEFLNRIRQTVRESKDLLPILEASREAFAKIKINRSAPKPLVGIVGEIFVRSSKFSNENIVRKIEEFGGEAWLPPFTEWMIYTNYIRYRETLEEKKFYDYILNFFINTIFSRDLHRLEKPFQHFLRNFHEPAMKQVEEWAAPFINITFRGEGVLGFGKSVDFVGKGASGMVNVMPFTCMPGTVFTSLIKRFRQRYNEIPFISIAYDGLDQSNNQIRLEAFMHQCAEYMKQKG
ncbi:hypothetical protein AMJ44_10420 [candidate division WOR-1 bacterium DG_54_3]|uniref:CoA activase n=1 Tax=candidate division WOR-1 bacterium DG_54_3 TaxID=1703775 RepID=A0A0S7XSH6_UNCSA|nr:MAG: hypothetical protein AMJ44_10420 [candidate division WOR-1 bacterium DG_54_3]